MKYKSLLLLPISTSLSGCLSLDGIASTGGATVGATLGSPLGPGGAVAGGLIGGVAGDALAASQKTNIRNYTGADGELSFWELLAFAWTHFTNNLVMILAILGILFIVSTYLGIRIRRPEEKKLEELIHKLIDK